MIVPVTEAKQYLRVDHSEDDELILGMLNTAEGLCSDVARVRPDDLEPYAFETMRTAILYTTAYLYEHREEADHKALVLSLRALLSGVRSEVF